MREALINLAYLLSATLFILTFKGLSHPRTAVRANLMGAGGMLIAVAVTLLDRHIVSFTTILAGMAVGALAGAVMAVKVRMTAMPQMVALLNGFGGGASVLVAGASMVAPAVVAGVPQGQFQAAIVASGIIGGVTFWGSLVAADKLQEWLLPGKPIHFRGQQAVNGFHQVSDVCGVE